MLILYVLHPGVLTVGLTVAAGALLLFIARLQSSLRPAPSAAAGATADSAGATASSAAMTPVIVLGGEANALSVARDLSRIGVHVYVISAPDSSVRYSRHCTWVDVPISGSTEDSWSRFLLSPRADHLHGSVLIACSDSGLGVLARHRAELASHFKLDISNTTAQLAMLDKLTTFEHARAAGIATPDYWIPQSREHVHSLRESLKFPLLVKPRLSHLFEARFGRKFVVVHNFDELMPAFDLAHEAGLQMLLVELIPGDDDQLSSYYTYLDEHGTSLFDFTKRVIRRYPVGMGTGCYHITDWVPQILEPSLKLFKQVGLRGLANVEFKYDTRDGKYKLMECNARFTAANSLVAASGFGLAEFVYNRIIGRPTARLVNFKVGVRLLDPLRDFSSYTQLRRMGKLSLIGWISSVMHRQTFPYFRVTDPGPSLARAIRPLRRLLRGTRRIQLITSIAPSAANPGQLS